MKEALARNFWFKLSFIIFLVIVCLYGAISQGLL